VSILTVSLIDAVGGHFEHHLGLQTSDISVF